MISLRESRTRKKILGSEANMFHEAEQVMKNKSLVQKCLLGHARDAQKLFVFPSNDAKM